MAPNAATLLPEERLANSATIEADMPDAASIAARRGSWVSLLAPLVGAAGVLCVFVGVPLTYATEAFFGQLPLAAVASLLLLGVVGLVILSILRRTTGSTRGTHRMTTPQTAETDAAPTPGVAA
jgi:hypothetical protein